MTVLPELAEALHRGDPPETMWPILRDLEPPDVDWPGAPPALRLAATEEKP